VFEAAGEERAKVMKGGKKKNAQEVGTGARVVRARPAKAFAFTTANTEYDQCSILLYRVSISAKKKKDGGGKGQSSQKQEKD